MEVIKGVIGKIKDGGPVNFIAYTENSKSILYTRNDPTSIYQNNILSF